MSLNDYLQQSAPLIDAAQRTQVFDVRAVDGRLVFNEATPRATSPQIRESMIPYPRDAQGYMTLNEHHAVLQESAGAGSTPNFPDLLRQGLMFDVFSGYNEMPVVYPQIVREVSSNKMSEEYLKDAGIGMLPVVAEGQPYPRAAIALNDGVKIDNLKRGLIIPITEEIRRFDQLGKVRDIANTLGRAARMTREQQVMNVLTTTGNYTRNSTTKDNDIGANYGSTTFGPAGLVTAYRTLVTMKDRKTGQYIGVLPNTLIVTPGLWFFARSLLSSIDLNRQGGPTTAEVYGAGIPNPFYQLATIVVSPLLGATYEWVLLEAKRAVYLQVVDPLSVTPPVYDESDDTYEYRVRDWYGVGMKDDRFAYFSNATAAPAAS